MTVRDADALVAFFKALADESRLKIVGLLASAERRVDELASLLDLKAPTVSHHLSRLKEVGLVTMRVERNAHYYTLAADHLRTLAKDVLEPRRIATLVDDEPDSGWERKVFQTFVQDGRITQIPSGQRKRLVILRWLADRFDRGRTYTHKEVNDILKRYNDDTASLRRYMVEHRLFARSNGIYRRT
jgi:DNA-binding HxlR family transcriptional regulator